MAEATDRFYCEWCAREVLPDSCPSVQGNEALASLKNIEDPKTLRFCCNKCKMRWFTTWRGQRRSEHPMECMCVECMG